MTSIGARLRRAGTTGRPLRAVARSGLVTVLLGLALLGTARLLAHGDLDLQIDSVSRELRRTPANPDLYVKRAELHSLHGDPAAALADLAVARRLDPARRDVDFAEGRALLAAERFSEARAALDRFLRAEPEHPIALWFRAQVLIRLEKRLEAEADLRECIRLAPAPTPELIMARAQNLEAAGDRSAASQVLEEGISRLGPVQSLQLAAVELEVRRSAFDAAVTRLETLIKTSPQPAALWVRKGEVLEAAGRSDEARESFRVAAGALERLSPRFRKTMLNRSLAAKIDQALRRLGTAIPE